MHVHSFAPVVDRSSRVLVLGSMPGRVSLRANEYYAHPQNAFWKLMGQLVGFEPTAPYRERLDHLLGGHIALWDVLKTCTRESSLDSDIDDASSVPNDFAALLSEHPRISTLCFNGQKAESSFQKLVAPSLPAAIRPSLHRLPSTSPAHASMPYARKLEKWGVVVPAE